MTWTLTIPLQTLKFIILLDLIVQQASGAVTMDSETAPGAITVVGSGEVPNALQQLGLTVLDGPPPDLTTWDWEPQTVWLERDV